MYISSENDENDNIIYIRGPVETMEKCKEKSELLYRDCEYPTNAQLLDINRCSLIFNSAKVIKWLNHFIECISNDKQQKMGVLLILVKLKIHLVIQIPLLFVILFVVVNMVILLQKLYYIKCL